MKSYEESCRQLVRMELLDGLPQMPVRTPRYDDEEPLGVQFFRTGLEDADLSGLSLPRTFVCRSEFSGTKFNGSNLRECSFCWSDFVDADFSDADLTGSDLRASNYERVLFRGARLDGVDMRRSNFVGCDFTGASLRGAVLTREQKASLALSEDQESSVVWADEDGPEPDGG
ncbi:MAG: pentapeptide repeat-containing protein [Hyphomonadaceae bacterium]